MKEAAGFVSLKITVPLILLGFAAILSAVNVLHFVPQVERAVEEDTEKRLAQEMSRLQSTMEYLILKGETTVAEHEIEALAHNHEVNFAALTNDRGEVIASTRRAWLGRPIMEVLPDFDVGAAAEAIRARRAGMRLDPSGNDYLGYTGILTVNGRELRPSHVGGLFVSYDLARRKAEARHQVLEQSLYWAGWVTALALGMWLAFHFLLTRRTAKLVTAAEQIAAGKLDVRSGLHGDDELGRLGRAFDAMARDVAQTQTRLRNDIADRKRASEALRVSEESYRAIFDSAEDAIIVRDVNTGAIVDVNPAACRAFGYTREEFRALDLGALSSGVGAFGENAADDLITRARAGEDIRVEWHSRTKSGALRWFEVVAKRATIGGQDRILSLARDIDDRKATEEALVASEEQYRAMFNASIDGLALWDAAGQLVDTNPALWRMYGYGEPDPAALRHSEWSGPAYPPDFIGVVAAGEPRDRELRSVRKDGSVMEIELHGIPMQYRGQPHVLTIARDVTDKKRAAEELARQRESLHQREKLAALGSLLAGVAHELNNPLSVVVARAVLLEERGDPATQSAAKKIRVAAERCARIVRTFLAMARQQRPERGAVAMNDVVTEALDLAAYPIRTSSIEVVLDLAPGIPAIEADADQLHQVLLNLVINAQQSLQDKPGERRIRIATSFDSVAQTVRVTVADNGPGIAPEVRARVFEPYFTTKPQGTGVGLAVSLGIVEAHGGTMSVDRAPEGGAAFTFVLPVGGAEVPPTSEHEVLPANDLQHAILIVDDEPEIRDMLADILRGADHEVATAGSGREALARIAAERYDVVVTDIRMPDMDGRALFQQIRERWPRLASRVVFVTGDTLTPALREFVDHSGRPVLEKPFLPADVRRIVGELAVGEMPRSG
jgi:PAS domain S-box-containing protein